MAMTLDEAVVRFRVSRDQIETWVAQRWIKPQTLAPELEFDEADVSRLQLICELRELEVNDEALPLVLQLLDQVYELRAQLHQIGQALGRLPEPVRAQLRELAEHGRD